MKPDKAIEITQNTRNIHGWFSSEAAMLFAWINEIQRLNGITGDIFEIEKLCVCDLFGDQDANTSGSGRGDIEIFERNLTLFCDRLKFRVFKKKSNTLSIKEIGNNYRFFHIDGGHNCEEALSDLRLAADSLIGKGVIALDDPFREDWPGVTEAVIRFLDEYSQYHAIIVGFNKLIIVRGDYSDLYKKEILKIEKRQAYKLDYPWQLKELPFNGYPLQIFYVPTSLAQRNLAFYLARQYYRYQNYLKNPLLRPFVGVTKAFLRKI
jgi:hypothetical protein